MKKDKFMEKIISLCKRKGFIFQSSSIYGGLNGCYDYGPLGSELIKNIRDTWWQSMTNRDDVEGLDASILMHSRVWEASGHVDHFTDLMVDCKNCKARFRTDEIIPEKPNQCPACGIKDQLTNARAFNLMFKTSVGATEDTSSVVYLRPETAQGIYVNYQNVLSSTRQKVPFGIAQIGKAFRNEINPRNFLYRVREFEQMEMQFFVRPGTDDEWFDYWVEQRVNWYKDLGLDISKLHLREVPDRERAHYAKRAKDFEYEFPFGINELEGVHNRTDYDLVRHAEFSGKNLNYFDQDIKERYLPYIIETSAGATRSFLAFLCDAYDEEVVNNEQRTVLHLNSRLAPIKVAVFPLVKRDGMAEKAEKIYKDLKSDVKANFDIGGAIGRRYRRQDEIGTPLCVTVDSQTLEDETVTVRERDSMEQKRVSSDSLKQYILDYLI